MSTQSTTPVARSVLSIAATEAAARRTARHWLMILIAVMALAAVLSWLWTGRAAREQYQNIQRSEAQIADSRAAAVSDWIASQRRTIDAVAANPTLVPYLASGGDSDLGAYVRNYLRDTAERDGFTKGLSQVPANVARDDGPGLAIIDAQGRVLVGIGGPLPGAEDMIATLKSDQMMVDGAAQLKTGSALRLLKALPTEGGARRFVYGVRLIDDDLFARLVQPGEAFGIAEQSLVAKRDKALLAVTNRGSFTAGETIDSDPLVRAGLAAIPQTVDVRDAANVRFLVSARPISGSNWVLLRARPAGLLLGDTTWRRLLSLAALLCGIGLAGALALLAWRHSVSAQLAETGAKEAQARQFLSTVSNSQPTGIYVIDGNGRMHFTNATAEKWPPLDRGALQPMIAAVRTGTPVEPTLINHGSRQLRLSACLLNPQFPQDDVLIVAEDLTELLAAHEQRQASQQALISTLTGLIDARDPGSKGHSQKVSHVAAAIGTALPLSGADVSSLRTAGELMNLGKILVPTALLTKSGPLSDDERAQVRAAMAKTSDLLGKVPFDGPVAETLEDLEQDPPRTRLGAVLRLANAFVGQVSPRAHRAALSADEALANLRQSGFDPAMLSALSHWLDNQGGRESLK
jgi:PAS domain-containing protein